MDPESFLEISNQVTKLKMYPYFDVAHSVLCALAVREDLGPGKYAISFFLTLCCLHLTIELLIYRWTRILQKAPTFLLAIHNAGSICRRNGRQWPSRRANAGTVEK